MARLNSDIREWTYRNYVADSLRLIPNNQYQSMTLREMLTPVKQDKRTAEEITNNIMEKAGLKWKE
jgi:light-regulated signal transduction histidine kinase (bacteriophytochrome)